MKWLFIGLLILVEYFSCISINTHQPYVTIFSCLTMGLIAYLISFNYNRKK